jgi:ADP-heptose:LPS heptosyltransferase
MIIISPFAKKMRNGAPHPKEYPYWNELIQELTKTYEVIQVGIEGEQALVSDFRKNLSLEKLKHLIESCDTWVSVDSFFQHYCWDIGKPGVVLFGQSDPAIFGHTENINLYADKRYFREKQFWLWEQTNLIKESFVDPKAVLDSINIILSNR